MARNLIIFFPYYLLSLFVISQPLDFSPLKGPFMNNLFALLIQYFSHHYTISFLNIKLLFRTNRVTKFLTILTTYTQFGLDYPLKKLNLLQAMGVTTCVACGQW